MQIRSLQLEDFKSYANTTLEFSPGTNAIVGHNGAGKSSIVEAIGFALFDSQPNGFNQSSFVKEGAKTATITVTFESSLDERLYQVIRRCGGSSHYSVFDPDLGRKVCENKADVIKFLREHLGVEAETNLSDLFSNAVGVPQGTLTSAFLASTSQRKPIFDPLLRVEEYKKASDNLRGAERLLETRQTELNLQISGLSARLERLPFLEGSLAALTRDIAKAETDQATVQTELQRVESERSVLETLRRQINEAVTAVNQAQQSMTHWQAQVGAADMRVQEAIKAQSLIEIHRDGHLAYGAAQDKQAALEADVRRRQTLRDQLAVVDKKLSLARAERQRHEASLAEVEAAIATVAHLSAGVADQDRLENALREAERRAARFDALQGNVVRQRRATADLEKRMAELQRQLQTVDSQQAALDQLRQNLTAWQATLDGTREGQGHYKAEAERLKAQVTALAEGDGVLCPVCEQPLDEEHRRTLLARNQTQLDALRAEWKESQAQIKEMDARVLAGRTQIQSQEEQLRRLPRPEEGTRVAAHLAESQQELAQAEAQVAEFAGASAEVKSLGQEVAALGNPRRQQELAHQKAATHASVQSALAAVVAQIESQSAALAELQKGLDQYADLDTQVGMVTTQLAANREADDIFRRNQQLAESLPSRQADYALAAEGLHGAQTQLQAKVETHASLSGRFDEPHYHKLSGREQALRGQLGALQGQLSEQRRRLHEQESERQGLLERQHELEQIQGQRDRLQSEAETLSFLRTLLREAGPYVTRALVRQISHEAATLFGEIMGDYSRRLRWDEEYRIVLEVDGHDRQFSQLSGGEQMSAALSVRLALLREMSNIDVAFFDEPTTNLDESRRESLARQILEIKGFRQLFVISHDDTFEQATERLIRVRKVNGVSVVEENPGERLED